MFGLVVIEAMAAGRPVITTALPSGVREVNVPGTTGLEVPLRDVSALAQALETLSHDAALRRRLGQAGQRRVIEQFSQTQMAQRHIALYQRILEGSTAVGDSGKRQAISG
jgi:rhamnosyl/mannosyltransferase